MRSLLSKSFYILFILIKPEKEGIGAVNSVKTLKNGITTGFSLLKKGK